MKKYLIASASSGLLYIFRKIFNKNNKPLKSNYPHTI